MTFLNNHDYNSEVKEIGHHARVSDGKKYIIINQTSWYDADKWTDETAAEDYVKTHSNKGFDFVPKFASKENGR